MTKTNLGKGGDKLHCFDYKESNKHIFVVTLLIASSINLLGCVSPGKFVISEKDQYIASVKKEYIGLVSPVTINPEINRISGLMDNIDAEKVGYIKSWRIQLPSVTREFNTTYGRSVPRWMI